MNSDTGNSYGRSWTLYDQVPETQRPLTSASKFFRGQLILGQLAVAYAHWLCAVSDDDISAFVVSETFSGEVQIR